MIHMITLSIMAIIKPILCYSISRKTLPAQVPFSSFSMIISILHSLFSEIHDFS
jgi:hypothetical protein